MGKLLGALFGFLLLNIPGLILGLLIGHSFDKGLRMQAMMTSPERIRQAQETFFETTFLLMGYIAKADGRVSEREIQFAREIMAQLQCDSVQRHHAIELFNQGKAGSFDFDTQLDLFVEHCGFQMQLVHVFLQIQIKVAYAEQVNLEPKRNVLNSIAVRFGIPKAVFAQLESQYFAKQNFYAHQQSPKEAEHDAYGILGVSESTSDAELKRAYKKLMSEHHPDKLVAKGLPEEMVKMATEKTQEIQKAYDLICKMRGLK